MKHNQSPFKWHHFEPATILSSDASVEEIAERVGYGDGATLRSLLRRRLNLGVKEIRRAP